MGKNRRKKTWKEVRVKGDEENKIKEGKRMQEEG